jgi:serine/threonine-protein kinase
MLRICVEERFQSADAVLSALGLEPHFDNLAKCLTTQRYRSQESENWAKETSSGYLPPVVRTATAIRDWKTKIKARESRGQGQKVRNLFASSEILG